MCVCACPGKYLCVCVCVCFTYFIYLSFKHHGYRTSGEEAAGMLAGTDDVLHDAPTDSNDELSTNSMDIARQDVKDFA